MKGKSTSCVGISKTWQQNMLWYWPCSIYAKHLLVTLNSKATEMEKDFYLFFYNWVLLLKNKWVILSGQDFNTFG